MKIPVKSLEILFSRKISYALRKTNALDENGRSLFKPALPFRIQKAVRPALDTCLQHTAIIHQEVSQPLATRQ